MFATILNSRIAAIRVALPMQEIRQEDELEFYGNSLKKAERARKMIGTERRRVAWPAQTASDLCFEAAKAILEDYSFLQDRIDALIFLSQFPDYDLPATACVLQSRLNLSRNCAAFDVNQGCSGYIYGLWLASSLTQTGCRHVLLLAGDVPYRPRDRNNRIVAPIFGDAGSATLISKDTDAEPLLFSLGTDGTGFENIILPAGRSRLPFSQKNEDNEVLVGDICGDDGYNWQLFNTCMDGQAVFSFTLNVIPAHIAEFFEKSGRDKKEIDNFFLHQANRQIITEIARKAGLPLERTPVETFSHYGNLSSASIPAAICDTYGKTGNISDKLLFLCGFGVGLSWGSCLWKAMNCDCAPCIDVGQPKPSPLSSPDYWLSKLKGKKHDSA